MSITRRFLLSTASLVLWPVTKAFSGRLQSDSAGSAPIGDVADATDSLSHALVEEADIRYNRMSPLLQFFSSVKEFFRHANAADDELYAFIWPPSIDLAQKDTPGLHLYLSKKIDFDIECFPAIDLSRDFETGARQKWFEHPSNVQDSNGVSASKLSETIGPGGVSYCTHVKPITRGNYKPGFWIARIIPKTDSRRDMMSSIVTSFCIYDLEDRRPILLQTALFSDQAYNSYPDGASFYNNKAMNKGHTNIVELARPIMAQDGRMYPGGEGPNGISLRLTEVKRELDFLRWLSGEKVKDGGTLLDHVDVCTNWDIHDRGTDLLKNRLLLISICHHEYWSREMADAVYQALNRTDDREGPMHYLNLGGNTYWRKVSVVKPSETVHSQMSIERCEDRSPNNEAVEYWHSHDELRLRDYMMFGVSTVWGWVNGKFQERFEIVELPDANHWAGYLFMRFPRLRPGDHIENVFDGDKDSAPEGKLSHQDEECDGARLNSGGTLDFSKYEREIVKDGSKVSMEMPNREDIVLFARARIDQSVEWERRGSSASIFDDKKAHPPNAAIVLKRAKGGGISFSVGTTVWAKRLTATNTLYRRDDSDKVEDAGPNLLSHLTRNVIVQLASVGRPYRGNT